MANALLIGWDRPVPGKEGTALELMGSATSFFDRMKRDGAIQDYEVILLDPHGGALNGYMLIKGTQDDVARLHSDEEFQRLVTRGSIVLQGFGVVSAHVGDGVGKMLARYRESI